MTEIVSVGMRDGQPYTVTADISDAEIARRKAAADARRAAMQPPLAGDVFLSHLTDLEYAGIIGAANAQLATGNAQLYRWIETVRATNRINLAGSEAQTAKAALIAAGLLTQERADLVFAAG
jgi:hypothetical protein